MKMGNASSAAILLQLRHHTRRVAARRSIQSRTRARAQSAAARRRQTRPARAETSRSRAPRAGTPQPAHCRAKPVRQPVDEAIEAMIAHTELLTEVTR